MLSGRCSTRVQQSFLTPQNSLLVFITYPILQCSCQEGSLDLSQDSSGGYCTIDQTREVWCPLVACASNKLWLLYPMLLSFPTSVRTLSNGADAFLFWERKVDMTFYGTKTQSRRIEANAESTHRLPRLFSGRFFSGAKCAWSRTRLVPPPTTTERNRTWPGPERFGPFIIGWWILLEGDTHDSTTLSQIYTVGLWYQTDPLYSQMGIAGQVLLHLLQGSEGCIRADWV